MALNPNYVTYVVQFPCLQNRNNSIDDLESKNVKGSDQKGGPKPIELVSGLGMAHGVGGDHNKTHKRRKLVSNK